MTSPLLQRIASSEQFSAEALVARIAVDYLEPLVRELLMHRPAAQVREAVKLRLQQVPESQRERVGAIFLRHCAPTRCAEAGRR
jgi:hypothetical protein